MNIEDYNKYYIQGSDHYLIPKDVFVELFNEMINWKEETIKLKKQLETYETYFNRFFKINNKTYDGKIVLGLLDKKETQQKEFIKYLEDEMKTQEKDILEAIEELDIYVKQMKLLKIEEILQKYKEIIEVSDENDKKGTVG